MYIECAKKVAAQDPTKGSTVILNELLADDVWLAQVSKILRCYVDDIFKTVQNWVQCATLVENPANLCESL